MMNLGSKLGVKGSATIEILYILPVIFLIFQVAIYIGFFFHDRGILRGIIYEASVIGNGDYHTDGEVDVDELEAFIYEKCELRLLFFQDPQVEIDVQEEEIQIKATVEKVQMKITVTEESPLYSPEEDIRKNLLQGEAVEGVLTTIWEELIDGD